MKKSFFSVLSALLASILMTTSALAGGSVKLGGSVRLSNESFSLGSLIARGTLTGLGRDDVTIVLEASGTADIICTNPGSNDVPGHSSPKISAVGHQGLPGNDPTRRNGRYLFTTETDDPETITWQDGGCPNPNWTARMEFVYWTNATIYLYQGADPANLGALIGSQNYVCQTTRYPASVSCTRAP
ncbi:MAG TPA: hypothetical protein VJ785_14515 [Anaerolineales bacterium]|nr:hypothetical protein [Anaerolineales bacterium]